MCYLHHHYSHHRRHHHRVNHYIVSHRYRQHLMLHCLQLFVAVLSWQRRQLICHPF